MDVFSSNSLSTGQRAVVTKTTCNVIKAGHAQRPVWLKLIGGI